MDKIRINENFIINLQGKSYVTYEGLLDYAHKNGLISIEVDILQVPNQENKMTAICMATAKTDKETFTDIGDASPASVNKALIPHIIRMASTRAKARALRDLSNIGMTAIEEISFEDNPNDISSSPPTRRQIDTLKQLSQQLDKDIDYRSLDKKSAGNLISQLLEKAKN